MESIDTFIVALLCHSVLLNLVNIGSDNGLSPVGNKPLPETMLSYRIRKILPHSHEGIFTRNDANHKGGFENFILFNRRWVIDVMV